MENRENKQKNSSNFIHNLEFTIRYYGDKILNIRNKFDNIEQRKEEQHEIRFYNKNRPDKSGFLKMA